MAAGARDAPRAALRDALGDATRAVRIARALYSSIMATDTAAAVAGRAGLLLGDPLAALCQQLEVGRPP